MSAAAAISAALASSDVALALRHSLAAWRRARCSVLGKLVDHVSSLAPDEKPREKADAFQKRWIDRAREPTELEVGWLCRKLAARVPIFNDRDVAWRVRYARRFEALHARLGALAALPLDPRIASAALSILSAGKHEDVKTLAGARALVAKHGDHRHVTLMLALVERPRGRSQWARRTVSQHLKETIAQLDAVLGDDEPAPVFAALLPTKPRRPDDAERIATEMLELVYGDPFNEELREVCADRLQEIGDPRGELMALQRLRRPSPETKRRIRALLSTHGETWLGPDLSLVLRSVSYRGGFPVHATLVSNAEADEEVWERALADKRLATIERLHRGKAQKWRHALFREAIEALQSDELDELDDD